MVLRGPLIVGDGSEIRTGAYLRGGVVLGAGCVVGAHTEVKRAILLDGAHAPHQNYVGDSILGRDVNLGAGTILSNVKNVGARSRSPARGDHPHRSAQARRRPRRRLPHRLQHGAQPRGVDGPGCVTYPHACLRSGFYPARTLVKLRQVQQQIALDRLEG